MPTYEYRCFICGENFNRREHIDEHAQRQAACPKCGSTQVEQQYHSVFVKTGKKS